LADEILFGRLRDGGRVTIDTGPDGLAFDYAPLPERPAAQRQAADLDASE